MVRHTNACTKCEHQGETSEGRLMKLRTGRRRWTTACVKTVVCCSMGHEEDTENPRVFLCGSPKTMFQGLSYFHCSDRQNQNRQCEGSQTCSQFYSEQAPARGRPAVLVEDSKRKRTYWLFNVFEVHDIDKKSCARKATRRQTLR